MALLCPVAFFSIWEHNIYFILTCVVLSIALVFALLIMATLIVAIIKKQYRNAGRIVGIGVLLIIYTFIVSLFAGMGEGTFDNFGKRHPIPEGMEYPPEVEVKPEEPKKSLWQKVEEKAVSKAKSKKKK